MWVSFPLILDTYSVTSIIKLSNLIFGRVLFRMVSGFVDLDISFLSVFRLI